MLLDKLFHYSCEHSMRKRHTYRMDKSMTFYLWNYWALKAYQIHVLFECHISCNSGSNTTLMKLNSGQIIATHARTIQKLNQSDV